MSHQTVANHQRWRQVLKQQRLANAERWLERVSKSSSRALLISNEYDNLLRALETTLEQPETFDLAYELIQELYPVVFGYSDTERWRTYLTRALELSRWLTRVGAGARLLVQIADFELEQGDLELAEDAYREALTCYEAVDERGRNYVITLAKLATLYALQGQIGQAIKMGQRALDISKTSEDPWAVAHSHLSLSKVCIYAHKWEEGVTHGEQAYVFYREQTNYSLLIRALSNLVACWIQLGIWDKAEEAAQELTGHLSILGDVRLQIRNLLHLGVIAFEQHRYSEAESVWQQALSLHSQIRDPTLLMELCNNLGMVYTKLAEWDVAQMMLARAGIISQELGNQVSWANVQDSLADFYEAQGKISACREVLQEAVVRLRDSESPSTQDWLRRMEERLAALPE